MIKKVRIAVDHGNRNISANAKGYDRLFQIM